MSNNQFAGGLSSSHWEKFKICALKAGFSKSRTNEHRAKQSPKHLDVVMVSSRGLWSKGIPKAASTLKKFRASRQKSR